MLKISLFRDELEELIEDEVVFSVRSVADQQCFDCYYEPETGRYITSDPIGLDGGINTYGYAYQNPTKFIDPDGRIALLLLLPIAGGIINGIFSGVSEALTCDSNFGSILGAAGGGFAGGLVGTGVGLGVGTLTGNVALAGGVSGNLVQQGLGFLSTGQSISPRSATFSTGLGLFGGVFAGRFVPTKGRLPSLTTNRTSRSFGKNSQRLLGQEGFSGAKGGTAGALQQTFSRSSWECQ